MALNLLTEPEGKLLKDSADLLSKCLRTAIDKARRANLGLPEQLDIFPQWALSDDGSYTSTLSKDGTVTARAYAGKPDGIFQTVRPLHSIALSADGSDTYVWKPSPLEAHVLTSGAYWRRTDREQDTTPADRTVDESFRELFGTSQDYSMIPSLFLTAADVDWAETMFSADLENSILHRLARTGKDSFTYRSPSLHKDVTVKKESTFDIAVTVGDTDTMFPDNPMALQLEACRAVLALGQEG